ncbi:hypothetical protein BDP27DRAFT_1377943 [Rhodocollybia butyracea]|uniref:Uncharacterized protein n=1 Tax=Rhodocollybia butyracea TaxID=206335 RepID=A0A9P5P5W8_9AGAR|nr:hypothetical protein BDP27DRAFT_1377943 [Rhodocollybia butyracea]
MSSSGASDRSAWQTCGRLAGGENSRTTSPAKTRRDGRKEEQIERLVQLECLNNEFKWGQINGGANLSTSTKLWRLIVFGTGIEPIILSRDSLSRAGTYTWVVFVRCSTHCLQDEYPPSKAKGRWPGHSKSQRGTGIPEETEIWKATPRGPSTSKHPLLVWALPLENSSQSTASVDIQSTKTPAASEEPPPSSEPPELPDESQKSQTTRTIEEFLAILPLLLRLILSTEASAQVDLSVSLKPTKTIRFTGQKFGRMGSTIRSVIFPC